MDRAEQAAAMAEQRAAGRTYQQIADHHGVSVATVARRLRSADASIKSDGSGPAPAEAKAAEMWQLWLAGHTQTEIADLYGITQSSVSERLTRYRQRLPETDRDDHLQRCLDQLDQMQRPLLDLVTGTPPPAYSNGRAMKDADDNLVPDRSLQIQAVKALLATQDRLAKFLGLDAPAKTEVAITEQVTEAARAAAERAKAYLAGGAAAAAGGGGDGAGAGG